MFGIMTGGASQGYKKEKSEIEISKTIDKYSQMKRFHHDHHIQVYMYALIYLDTDTVTE